MQVFEDILDRLGGDVTLIPCPEPTLSKHFSKDRTGQEPLRVVEFASKQYFCELEQPTQSNEDDKIAKISAPTSHMSAESFILPIGRQMPDMQYERTIIHVLGPTQQQNSPRRPRLLDPINDFRSKLSTLRSKASASNAGGKGKARRGMIQAIGRGLLLKCEINRKQLM